MAAFDDNRPNAVPFERDQRKEFRLLRHPSTSTIGACHNDVLVSQPSNRSLSSH